MNCISAAKARADFKQYSTLLNEHMEIEKGAESRAEKNMKHEELEKEINTLVLHLACKYHISQLQVIRYAQRMNKRHKGCPFV